MVHRSSEQQPVAITPASTDTSKNRQTRAIRAWRVVEEDAELAVGVLAVHSHTVRKGRFGLAIHLRGDAAPGRARLCRPVAAGRPPKGMSVVGASRGETGGLPTVPMGFLRS